MLWVNLMDFCSALFIVAAWIDSQSSQGGLGPLRWVYRSWRGVHWRHFKTAKNTTKTTKTVKPRLKVTKTESKEKADKRKKIGSVVCQIQLWFSGKLMGVLMKIIWNFATWSRTFSLMDEHSKNENKCKSRNAKNRTFGANDRYLKVKDTWAENPQI